MPDPKRLAATLTPAARRALEQAAARALRETHATVEPEHLLLELCRTQDTDVAFLLQQERVDPKQVVAGLEAVVARFARGSPRVPSLSGQLVGTMCAAWVTASVDLGLGNTGSASILRAIHDDPAQRSALLASVPAFAPAFASRLLLDLPELLRQGPENRSASATAAGQTDRGGALAEYTIDLTALARAGRIDPVIGRDLEIRQIIDVLMRRRQNNPILTGAAGVGKTAIVEGFACSVAEGRVPPRLAGLVVRSLDLGLLQAGASMRGEYEQRLRAVLDEAAASMPRTVLFIDEAHMLIGAGGAAGQNDAANLLKPALARGELGVIAATTWSEYKRFIEKDPALARRFQVIRIAEPAEDTAVEMLRGLAPKLEAHHGVRILEEALAEAVRLSHRYITGRQLPEKAIAVLDTACARVAIAHTTPPFELEDAERRCMALDAELTRLRAEAAVDDEHAERLEAVEEARDRAEEQRLLLSSRWQLEQDTLARLAAVEARLGKAGNPTDAELRQEWAGLRLELDEVQRQNGTLGGRVGSRAIAEVVSGWTSIPVGQMLADTLTNARALKSRMAERIVDQDAALDTICRRIQTFYADLGEPNKPTGVFLLCGPSGVGKTETALTLADLLFGGPRALVTVNMSEYQEAHAVSGLRGAPPGYVGYGSGGTLTEAVRRQPYCVLLLDEVEKAHPDVMELFYQVFDRGMLEDSEGQLVDFTNTVILLTSNVGAEVLSEIAERRPSADGETLSAAIRPVLLRHFPAAFLGRLVVVPYRPLSLASIVAVTRLKLQRIQDRFAMTRRGELTYHPDVVRMIAERAGASESGARMVDTILTHSVLPALSGRILDHLADGKTIAGAHLSIGGDGGLAVELKG
jgi:type VI secretion system protein VasG